MDYLLWFDDSNAPAADRIARATRCLLPKEEAGPGPTGLTCARDPLVLPSHIWIGSE